ncbi:PEP-CTERM sorting domain-containing protein [Nevskia soli]|jgi:hypothetical protein|uniref:PEP-CTERM sorting domain-containing protein n=1 Tax=Nevskia soli TaxID=418856 RepID=UPI0015D6AA7C|nr:PEP-CTERM sorting domain-containing protein [Nevskia soli]
MKATLFMLVCGFTATGSLFAGTATVTFTGPNGQQDSYGNYISPYYGTVNGSNATLYCDDFANYVTDGETWTANVTNLADSAEVLTQTRYGGLDQTLQTQGGGTQSYDGQQLYEMAAYLSTQFDSNATDDGNIQDTIWDLFNPNAGNSSEPGPIPSTEAYLYAAEQNYGSINAANFEILTQVNNPGLTGGIQEFIVATPEPSSMLMLGCGLMFVSAIVYRRRKANPNI